MSESTMISVRIPVSLHEKCKEEGINMSKVIRMALTLMVEDRRENK